MDSKRFQHWVSVVDYRRCIRCKKMHGKIYYLSETIYTRPPLHVNCRCKIKRMIAIQAGLATNDGKGGADYWLIKYQKLPSYYVTEKMASQAGWISKKGNFDILFPAKMLAMGIYQNRNGHLPQSRGRVWYEADINYSKGHRNSERILYSSDGLIFVTYDHYHTFHEIVV